MNVTRNTTSSDTWRVTSNVIEGNSIVKKDTMDATRNATYAATWNVTVNATVNATIVATMDFTKGLQYGQE